MFLWKTRRNITKNGFNSKQYRYYDGYLKLNNDKFQVRDAEILIAGNSKEEVEKIIYKHLKTYSKLEDDNIKYIINAVLNSNICIPTSRELRSYFYGNAYISKFYGECKNYKKKGIELYNEFLKKNYKFYIVFADSSELCRDINKTIKIIKKDKEALFGSGLLLYLLTNNFSDNDSNIFNKRKENILFSNNVWD